MIWDDPDFRSVYDRELNAAVLVLEAEARTQDQKFAVDVGRAGVVAGVHLAHTAGGIASTVMSGYVRQALVAFDRAVEITGAAVDENDVAELRRRVEAELLRREESLPRRLKALFALDPGKALQGLIASQAPKNAHGLLARRVENDLAGIRFRRRKQEPVIRTLFISHAGADKALALALKASLAEYLGPDIEIFVSSDLRSIPGGADPYARIMAAVKASPITIALVTPNFGGRRWLYYETGAADGANRLVIPCIARGSTFEGEGLPLNRKQGRDLRDSAEIVALMLQVRAELGLDVSSTDPSTDVIATEARRPALGGGLSPGAMSVCEAISTRSERAEPKGDPHIETAKLAVELDIAPADLAAIVAELKSQDWVVTDGMRLGPDGLNPRWFYPTPSFFLATEAAFGGPDPAVDAKRLAAAAVNNGDSSPSVRELAEALGWTPRRANIALYGIAEHAADSPKSPGLTSFAYAHLFVTGSLRAFARRSSE